MGQVDNPDEDVVKDQIERSEQSMIGSLPYGEMISAHSSKTSEPITAKQAADRWKNRRRMAYISLLAMIGATVALFWFVPADRLDTLQEPVGWFYIAMASIVGAYCGFATFDDKWRGGRERD